MRKLTLLLLLGQFALAANSFGQDVNTNLLKSWKWRLIGPSMPAGRAWAVVGVPSNPKTLYVTTAGGGLWKTSNNGTTFDPIFDYENTASTGAVAIAPSNTDIVWLGTGEAANTRANSWGDGVYKSLDGGKSWKHMGLDDSFMIGKIVINPTNPDIVVVGAMGHLWGTNQERGIFRTTDGGHSWQHVLYVNDTTGVMDVQIDPNNSDVLYATTWQRFRFGGGDMDEAGPESGIYKSTDGGANWRRLSNGLPTDHMGKIQIAVAYHNSNIVYAAILAGEPGRGGRTSKQGGVFRSDNGGENWTRVNSKTTNYYYQHIYVDPSDDETVWMPVFELNRSTDGGKNFEKINMRHVHNDLHSMWIDPNDPEHIAVSGDGGVSISYDRGATWQQTVLPIGQFYEVSVDNQDPYHVIGGMQDTGHWLGPNRTYDEEGTTMLDWSKLRNTGDGMASATDPRDPNIIWMLQQFGNTSRLDLRTWTRKELQPRDADELSAKGVRHRVRWNWTPAFALSIHNPDIAYVGSNYLFRINGATNKWDVISDDLTWQQDRTFKGIKDGYHSYGSLFSIAESPLDERILWTGADDGPIWVTFDGATSWKKVDDAIPDAEARKGVVAEIEASRFDKNRAYVTYDGHARDDVRPHVYRTNDGGKSWVSISGNLPAKGSAYVIREDRTNPNVLYVGTEFGVFITINGGERWTKLQNNFPTVAVRAMVIQERDADLVAGTFGRSIWVTDIAPFSEMTEDMLNEEVHIFKMKPGTLFKHRVSYGNTIEELNGDMFFRGENPPRGTEIVYYLKNDVDKVNITIINNNGQTIRTLTGSGQAGIHRVLWDLKPEAPEGGYGRKPRGITTVAWEFDQLVKPGNYYVRIKAGYVSAHASVNVRPEPEGGVKQVPIRK